MISIVRKKPTFFALLLFLGIVYAPVLVRLLSHDWARPESGQAPIVLVLALWLLYRNWQEDRVRRRPAITRLIGCALLQLLAASMYMVGSVGDISQLAYGSLIPLLVGALLLLQQGTPLARSLFPIFFLIFSVPLPGFIVDPITLPMKRLVAFLSENILHAGGLPVARSGVMLYLGQYELQIADACAGLRTLFTLEALGLLYINLVESPSRLRDIAVAVLVVPISLIANVTRVVTLCLITYYFGDAAGQGFLHEFAGLVLFVCALLLLIGGDLSIRSLMARRMTMSR